MTQSHEWVKIGFFFEEISGHPGREYHLKDETVILLVVWEDGMMGNSLDKQNSARERTLKNEMEISSLPSHSSGRISLIPCI